METTSRPTEKIIKQGNKNIVIRGVTNCKTFRKALQVLIGNNYKKGNTELEFYTRGILELYNRFHPEKIAYGKIEGWKGKSGITDIQKLPDRIIIKRFQKPEKGEEPKEVRIEITKERLEVVLRILNKLSVGEKIKTRDIVLPYCALLGIKIYSWKDFFSNRKEHNLLTNILAYLDNEEIIIYKGGVSTMLKNKLNYQLIL